MVIVSGTKREITLDDWKRQLEIQRKRLNDSIECFDKFSGTDDVEMIREDAEKILSICDNLKQVIEFMDRNGIR